MNTTPVTSAELRTVETVLEVRDGAVLDFSVPKFVTFFREHGVDIEDARYSIVSPSRANRLRAFLRDASPPRSGEVLAALLDYRRSAGRPALDEETLARYIAVVDRLGGRLGTNSLVGDSCPNTDAEAALLTRDFEPEVFARLPCDTELHAMLIARMREAQTCVKHGAFLSAVILAGSVLEAMCLGFGEAHPELVNRAYTVQYRKDAPSLRDWRLREWVTVLRQLGAFSPNLEKFGHALREFRNYVHPAEQLAGC